MAAYTHIYNKVQFLMEQKIKDYLKDPSKNPRPRGDEDPHFLFLIAYLGELFVQGYRIIEKYGDVLLLSLMEFQFSQPSSQKISRSARKIPPRFKLLSWQYSSKQLFQSGKYRRQLYSKMLEIGSLLEQIQYSLIYLRECRYSIVPQACLQKNALPHCEQYFRKIQWIQQKNGCRPIMEKEEGIELHRLAQAFIKGAGQARNPNLMRKIQGQNKFVYDLFKVVNTICYIIGKEILQNDYQTMSVEKWMRKFTQKKFKRFDLLMRSQGKCKIIDWKFTRLDADEKIKGASTQRKNQIYCQLARKDYKTDDIELWFYCLHERTINNSYHCFSCKKFDEHIKTVEIEEPEESKNNKQSQLIVANQVFIDDDSFFDLIPDAPGDIQLPRVSIALDNQEPSQQDQNKLSLPQNVPKASKQAQQRQRSQRENVPINLIAESKIDNKSDRDYSQIQRILVTNKTKIKSQKLKSKAIPLDCEVFEILSD